jgi:ADP-heptose:LPS heptosyltransferase
MEMMRPDPSHTKPIGVGRGLLFYSGIVRGFVWPRRVPDPASVRAIGVITGSDRVGDALLKLPFVRALRSAFPRARIHWITSSGRTAFASVLRDMTQTLIDEVHETPPWIAPGSSSIAPAFDILIDTRNRLKTALVARRLPHRLFLASAARHLISDRKPNLFRPRPTHLSDRLMRYVEMAAGYRPDANGALPVPEPLLQTARRILPDGAVYVGLAIGSSTPARTWPRDRFIALARIQEQKGRVPVFVLGPLEVNALPLLRAEVPGALFPLQDAAWGEERGLGETLALCMRLHVIVGNDSGPGHMMAAVDRPVVSLFGPTTPAKAAPRTRDGISVRAQDFGGDGMEAIPVEAVAEAVDRMLERTGAIRP